MLTVFATALVGALAPRTVLSTVIDFSNHAGSMLLPYSEDGLTFTMSPNFADGRIDTSNNGLVLAAGPTGVEYTVTASRAAGAPFNLDSLVFSATNFFGLNSFTIASDRGGSISIDLPAGTVERRAIDFSGDLLFQDIGSFSIDHGPSLGAPSFEVIVDGIVFTHPAAPPTDNMVGLAWGVPAPRATFNFTEPFTGDTRTVLRSGTTPAATVTPAERLEIKQRVEDIFADSDITNIQLVDGELPGETNVYFADPTVEVTAGGFALTCDQFNMNREDSALVYFFDDLEFDAELTAHEIGHMFGLRHVNPSNVVDPSNLEVMDYDLTAGDRERFINAVSEITEPPDATGVGLGVTHNPLYHLERYVDGETHDALAARDVDPGDWDLTPAAEHGQCAAAYLLSLDFSGSTREIFDVSILTGHPSGHEPYWEELDHFDSIMLSELETMLWEVEAGKFVQILAASTAGGALDTVLATGDPFELANHGFQALIGRREVFLQMAVGANSFATFAVGTANILPEPNSLGLFVWAWVYINLRRCGVRYRAKRAKRHRSLVNC